MKQFRPLLKRLKREVAEEQLLAGKCPKLKSPHPFPAKMGMDIVWDELKTMEKEKHMAAMPNAKVSDGGGR